MLEVATHCTRMFKNVLTRRWDMHKYDTRGRDAYRTGWRRTVVYERRTVVYEHLPSQVGVQIVNSSMTHSPSPKAFSTDLVSNKYWAPMIFTSTSWYSTCASLNWNTVIVTVEVQLAIEWGFGCYTDGLNRRCIGRRQSFLKTKWLLENFYSGFTH